MSTEQETTASSTSNLILGLKEFTKVVESPNRPRNSLSCFETTPSIQVCYGAAYHNSRKFPKCDSSCQLTIFHVLSLLLLILFQIQLIEFDQVLLIHLKLLQQPPEYIAPDFPVDTLAFGSLKLSYQSQPRWARPGPAALWTSLGSC